MNMESFDEVWIFVEEKLKCSVPAYFKNVLKVCGYDNIISISTIEEDDIQYFEQEVRNGNVSKYFLVVGGINILDGSTKTVSNFEFTRGHKKFLIFIRDFLKNYLNENDPNCFVESAVKKKCEKDAPIKGSNSQTLTRNLKLSNKKRSELQKELQKTDMKQDMKIHQGILICKVIMCLINTTPAMYAMNMESIHQKISKDLLKIQIKDKKSVNVSPKISEEKLNIASILEALIYCPFCSTTIIAFHKTTEANKFLWNVSNLNRHLEFAHLNQTEFVDSSTKNRQIKDETLLETTMKELQETTNSQESNFTMSCTNAQPKNTYYPKKPITDEAAIPWISQKHVECMEDRDEKEHEKLISTSIVCHSDTSVGNEELQSYSEILIASSLGKLKFEQNRILLKNAKEPKNVKGSKNVKELSKEFHGFNKKNELIIPQLGNYVICSLFVKDTIQWPANTNIKKNFVGKICRINENVRNDETTEETREEIDIQFLKKSRYSTFIFSYPKNIETSRISRNRIVKILQDPLQNRRGEFVFKDKSISDYIF